MNPSSLSTPLAVVGLVALAFADMWLTHGSQVVVMVVSGLLGWMSHKAIAESGGPPPQAGA